MCGIVGVLRLDGAPTPAGVLARMTAALAHRGPDAQQVQVVADGPVHVGLGHTRLKILDLSDAAGQPMASDDGKVRLVFNGELYNFRELRAQLRSRGARFSTSSDTEVLLRLYEAEGLQGLARLDGMFAFGLWDGRHRRLVLARDRMGKKPLFYWMKPGCVAFASEIKALLRHPDIVPEIAVDALPAFFLFGYVPTPGTLYQGIRKLPPASWMEVRDTGEVRIAPYWELALAPRQPRPRQAEAAAAVRELATDAVRRRLVADVPLGAFLSGGVDSTIVVGIMSQLRREPVRTFSIGFAGDPAFDETSYARLAARRFGTVHTEFVAEPSSVDLVDQLVYHHDGPFADSSAIPTYLLSRLTRDHVTVALTGDGGDELFAGYLRFYAALAAERVPAWVRQAVRRLLGGLPEEGGHRSLQRQLRKFAASAALPFEERFSRWISVFYEDLPRLLPGCRAEKGWGPSGTMPPPLALLAPHLARSHGASPLTRLLHLNLQTYLLDDLLVKMDRCSMAHGLEARSPFLDRALLDYVMSLPDSMKVRWGRTKVILRQAFADLVPPAILRRGKMGFGVPLRAWFSRDLRQTLQEVLLAGDARLRRFVDQDYVRQLCAAHVAGRADHAHRLWTLLTFEVWWRNLSLEPVCGEGPPAFTDAVVTAHAPS